MSQSAENLTRVNHYATFLLRTIYNELYVTELNNTQPRCAYVVHQVPITAPGFLFFPVHVDHTDPVYHREVDEYANLLKMGTDPAGYREKQQMRFARKKSLFLQKLLSISEDFVSHIRKISQECKIPVPSIISIILLMNQDVQSCIAPSGAGVHSDSTSSQPDDSTRGFLSHYSSIAISESVPPGERDALLLNVNYKIYDLFQEAFWVLLIAGMADLINTFVFAKCNNLDNIKKYLLEGAAFHELEDRVREITTTRDLHSYLQEEYGIFRSIFPEFAKLCMKYIGYSASKRFRLRLNPVGHTIDPSSISYKVNIREIEEMHESICEAIDKNVHPVLQYGPVDRQEYFITAERDEDSIGASEPTITRRRREDRSSEEVSFADELTFMAVKQLLYEPMKSYRLKGGPANLIKYIRTIIDKRSLSMIDEHHNAIIKASHGVSARTLKRYKKESGSTYDVNNTQAVRRKKEASQKHERPGYVTLNKLAAILNDNEAFKRNRIPLNKYSVSTLKNKIKKLIDEKKITVEQNGIAYAFKLGDIPDIAREIVKSSS